MYWWGRTKNNEWYDSAIAMLEEALDNDSEIDRKELVRALISVQVKADLQVYFAGDSMAAELLWIDWVLWFNHTYSDAPKSFHALALYCFEYVHWSIAQVNYHAHTPPHRQQLTLFNEKGGSIQFIVICTIDKHTYQLAYRVYPPPVINIIAKVKVVALLDSCI
jgi:hypothetical protein